MSFQSRRRTAGRGDEGGFTLIELLVVIIILGILSAVVVFAVRGAGDKGSAAATITDRKTLQTAQEAFCANNNRYGTEAELVAQKLLSTPSEFHDVSTAPGGPCGTTNQSKFTIVCDASKPGATCTDPAVPVINGTLVINNGATAPAATLNPAITSEGGTHSNSEDMFNGLLRYEQDGSIGGDLAQTFNFNNSVPSGSNPNCASATCDPVTTVATFVLRPDVKFHDGTTLTPDDVEFSFAKAILAAHGRTRAIIGTLGVTGGGLGTQVPENAITTLPATAGNGGTVIFNLRQAYTPLRFTLNVTEAPIISKSVYGPCFDAGTLFSGTACAANTNPVGTGPFKFKSLDSTGIRTVKNPDYFRFDANGVRLPYLGEIWKRVIGTSGLISLQSGDVDVASIATQDRTTAAGDSRIVLSSTPRGTGGGNCITTIAFNTTKRQAGSAVTAPPPPGGAGKVGAPATDGGYPATSPYYGQNKAGTNENASPHKILGDSKVREAIFKSLDRVKYWNDVTKGAGRVADAPVHSIFQPNGAYQGPQPLPTFDRVAAGALLDAAGWSDKSNADGFRRALNHPNKTNPDPDLVVADGDKLALEMLASSADLPDEMKSQLKTVGIDITTVTGNNTSVVAPRLFRARTYDMGQISYCNNDEPQFGVRRQYHTDALLQTDAFTNASGYKSTIMDQLWVEASKAPDVATYQAKFLAIQRLALGLSSPGVAVDPGSVEEKQKIPMVQMTEAAGTRGTSAKCKGFNNNNTGLFIEAATCTK